MEDSSQDVAKKEQKARHRSPNYPSIGLKAAVAKITALYKQDGLAPSQKLAAIKHLGYERLHSDAARTLSALKSFGLIEESDERIRLTQRGIDIVVRQPEDARRLEAVRAAALGPEIYRELLAYYKHSGLPSDTTLRSELIAVRKFNPDSVDGMIRAFKETLDFSNLSGMPVIEAKQGAERNSDEKTAPKIGDLVQWESAGQIQFTEPRKVRELTPDGQWAFIEGATTGLPVEDLTIVEAVEAGTSTLRGAALPLDGPGAAEKPATLPTVPQMRSYSWALSGDFNARMELFGDAQTEEDLDALMDYMELTIKALKRSLKNRTNS